MREEPASLEHGFAGQVSHREELDLQDVMVLLLPKLADQILHLGVRIDQREGSRCPKIAQVPCKRPSANLFGNRPHLYSPTLYLLDERLGLPAQVANQSHLLGPRKLAQDMEDPDLAAAALRDGEVGGDEQNPHGHFNCWGADP